MGQSFLSYKAVFICLFCTSKIQGNKKKKERKKLREREQERLIDLPMSPQAKVLTECQS